MFSTGTPRFRHTGAAAKFTRRVRCFFDHSIVHRRSVLRRYMGTEGTGSRGCSAASGTAILSAACIALCLIVFVVRDPLE